MTLCWCCWPWTKTVLNLGGISHPCLSDCSGWTTIVSIMSDVFVTVNFTLWKTGTEQKGIGVFPEWVHNTATDAVGWFNRAIKSVSKSWNSIAPYLLLRFLKETALTEGCFVIFKFWVLGWRGPVCLGDGVVCLVINTGMGNPWGSWVWVWQVRVRVWMT